MVYGLISTGLLGVIFHLLFMAPLNKIRKSLMDIKQGDEKED